MTAVRPDFTIEQNWQGYSGEEHAIWRLLFERQQRLLLARACREYLEGLSGLGVAADGIPDFRRLSDILNRATGWRIVAVPGLVPDDVFFAHLARRQFPSTCFVRRRDQLDYLQEPDVFHDICGHVPLLMNPVFADYMQAYGEGGSKALGLGHLQRLARLYWYTVEFGLIATESGPAHLWVRHSVLGRRVDLLSRKSPTSAAAVRYAPHHANPIPYRRLPAALFRYRRFPRIVRCHQSGFCADLPRNRRPA